MTITIPRGCSDPVMDAIIAILEQYQADHGSAQIEIYRQNVVSVRIRIIDPDFCGQSKSQRNHAVWDYLDRLPEEVQGDISMLVLLTPAERKSSFASLEFDDPVESSL